MNNVSLPIRICISTLFLVLFLATSGSLHAQMEVIMVDTTTGAPSKPLPFHRPFVLKMLAKQDNYKKIYLIDHIGNKTLTETLTKRTINYTVETDAEGNAHPKMRNKHYDPPLIPSQYYFTKKEGDKTYLIIRFKDTLTLQPSTNYSLIVYTDPGTDALAIFRILHKSYLEADLRKKAVLVREAVTLYNKTARGLAQPFADPGQPPRLFFGMAPVSYPPKTQIETMGTALIEKNGVVAKTLQWPTVNGKLFGDEKAIEKVNSIVEYSREQVSPHLKFVDDESVKLSDAVKRRAPASLSLPSSVPPLWGLPAGLIRSQPESNLYPND